jgi:hypothetical protein
MKYFNKNNSPNGFLKEIVFVGKIKFTFWKFVDKIQVNLRKVLSEFILLTDKVKFGNFP